MTARTTGAAGPSRPLRYGLRRRARRVAFGLATVLGLRRLGFFIPYRYAAGVEATGYPELEPVFAAAEPRFGEVLARIGAYGDDLRGLRGPAPAPRFDQGWFPPLDAAAAYAIVRTAGPKRIVEVGSGHSTRFLARAVRDEGLATEQVSIDPAPRASLEGLPVRRRGTLVQDAPADEFAALGAGDVLFVDSSHVLMPGTDVDHVVNLVLPALAPGVLVHFHDVFLPDGYPGSWAWRGYNEQNVLGALLQGGAFAPLFASRYLLTRRPASVDEALPPTLAAASDAPACSLWLEKRC